MRNTTSHRRPAKRMAMPASRPRSRVVQAFIERLGTITGRRRRDAERARQRFEGLEFDQRVRELGEW